MSYLITDNLFDPAQAMGEISQSKQASASASLQLLQSIKGTADVVQKISANEFNKEMKIREQDAIVKGIEQAKIDVKPEQYNVDLHGTNTGRDTVYDQAYNKAALSEVAANISSGIQTNTARLAQEYKYDPDGFKGATVAIGEDFIKQFDIQPEHQGIVFDAVKSEINRYLPKIAAAGYEKVKKDAFAAKQKEYETFENISLNSIRNGNYDQFQSDYQKMSDRLDIMVANGDIDIATKNNALTKYNKEAQSQMLLGQVDSSLEKNNLTNAIAQRNNWEETQRKMGVLSPDEIDSELRRVDTQISQTKTAMDKNIKLGNIIRRVMSTGEMLDYKDKDDKLAVNTLADETLGANPDYDDDRVKLSAASIATTTGVVPNSFKSYIRKTQFSSDLEVVLAGVQTMQSLLDTRPEFKDQFESKDIAFSDTVTSYVNAGMAPDEAIIKAREIQTADFQTLQKANLALVGNTNDYNKQVNNGVSDFIDNQFDTWYSLEPDVSDNNKALIRADYDKLLKYNLGKTGDIDAAKKATERSLMNKYAVTYINGKKEVVPYPIEKKVFGSNSYDKGNAVAEQWQDTRNTLMSELKIKYSEDIKLMPSTTNSNVYQVFVKNEFGIYSPLKKDGKFATWNFDSAIYNQKIENEKELSIEEAQEKHKQLMEYRDNIRQGHFQIGESRWG